jgi:hypothetical protein
VTFPLPLQNAVHAISTTTPPEQLRKEHSQDWTAMIFIYFFI